MFRNRRGDKLPDAAGATDAKAHTPFLKFSRVGFRLLTARAHLMLRWLWYFEVSTAAPTTISFAGAASAEAHRGSGLT